MHLQDTLSRGKIRPSKLAVEASIFATLILGTAFFLPQAVFAAEIIVESSGGTDTPGITFSGNAYFDTDIYATGTPAFVIGTIQQFDIWAKISTGVGTQSEFEARIYINTTGGAELVATSENTEILTDADVVYQKLSFIFSDVDIASQFFRSDIIPFVSGGGTTDSWLVLSLVRISGTRAWAFDTAVPSQYAGIHVRTAVNSVTPQENNEMYKSILSGEVGQTNTRIINVTPENDEVIATSTSSTFGATGYVNENDFEDGMFVQIKYAPYSASQAAVASPDLLFTTIQFPISSAGAFDVSDTSPVETIGQYTMQTEIRTGSWLNSTLNFFGFGQFANYGILTATSTTFIADHLSGYDIFIASSTEALNAYYASSTISFASCSSFTSFNLLDCLNLLFVPQTTPIAEALDGFKNGFLQYAPWGYLTRTLTILTGNATTSLPAFSATVPLGSAADVATFTFDIEDMLTGGGTLLNSITENVSGSDFNLQDVAQPILRLFIAIFVVLIILRDLMRVEHPAGSPNFNRRGV